MGIAICLRRHFFRGLFYILVVCMIAMPLFSTFCKKLGIPFSIDFSLSGAYVMPERPSFSIKTILDGSFQTNFEKYFNSRLVGRNLMTRLYNQILYFPFRSTDSTSIEIGKDDYLFERWYPAGYLSELDSQAVNALKNKIRLLKELQIKLNERGKIFLVIITPSKASIYSDCLPRAYRPYVAMKENGEYGPNGYEVFLKHAEELGIFYFDRHEMFVNMRRQTTPPPPDRFTRI